MTTILTLIFFDFAYFSFSYIILPQLFLLIMVQIEDIILKNIVLTQVRKNVSATYIEIILKSLLFNIN
jgi:hypothetical protein